MGPCGPGSFLRKNGNVVVGGRKRRRQENERPPMISAAAADDDEVCVCCFVFVCGCDANQSVALRTAKKSATKRMMRLESPRHPSGLTANQFVP